MDLNRAPVGFAPFTGFIQESSGAQGPKLRMVDLNRSTTSFGTASAFAQALFRAKLPALGRAYFVTFPYNPTSGGSAAQSNCSVSSMPATPLEPIWSLVEGRHVGYTA